MVVLEQVVQVSLRLCIFLPVLVTTRCCRKLALSRLQLGSFVFVLRRFVALLAPVDGIAQCHVLRARLAREHSL